jgi:hypothetical protein
MAMVIYNGKYKLKEGLGVTEDNCKQRVRYLAVEKRLSFQL